MERKKEGRTRNTDIYHIDICPAKKADNHFFFLALYFFKFFFSIYFFGFGAYRFMW